MSNFKYYVCNEFGDVLYEFNTEAEALAEAARDETYSVSRRQLLTED